MSFITVHSLRVGKLMQLGVEMSRDEIRQMHAECADRLDRHIEAFRPMYDAGSWEALPRDLT